MAICALATSGNELVPSATVAKTGQAWHKCCGPVHRQRRCGAKEDCIAQLQPNPEDQPWAMQLAKDDARTQGLLADA